MNFDFLGSHTGKPTCMLRPALEKTGESLAGNFVDLHAHTQGAGEALDSFS